MSRFSISSMTCVSNENMSFERKVVNIEMI